MITLNLTLLNIPRRVMDLLHYNSCEFGIFHQSREEVFTGRHYTIIDFDIG